MSREIELTEGSCTAYYRAAAIMSREQRKLVFNMVDGDNCLSLCCIVDGVVYVRPGSVNTRVVNWWDSLCGRRHNDGGLFKKDLRKSHSKYELDQP